MNKIIMSAFLCTLLCCKAEVTLIPAHMEQYGTIDEICENIEKGLIVEKVTLHVQKNHGSVEKILRKGLLHRRENAKANILMCHGFMCNKFDIGFLRKLFGDTYNFLTFDFRAHGENTEGQFCTFGRDEALDVVAAAQFMKHHNEIGHLPLFAYGFSMGAASIIEAQARHPYLFKAQILDCPFDSVENVIKKSIGNLTFSFCGYRWYLPGRTLLHKYAFHPYVQAIIKPLLKIAACLDRREIETIICEVKPAESIKKIHTPSLFIYCKNDEKVSEDAMRRVYEGASGYKLLFITNGRSHCDSFVYNPEGYGSRVDAFVKAVLDGSIEQKKHQITQKETELSCGREIL